MRKEEFRNEKLYQTTMSIAQKMLKEGIVSEEEYRRIDTIFLEKYRPVFGTLFSDISLTVLVKHFCNSTTYIFKNDIELHKESDNYCMNVACHGCTSHRQILQ